MNKHRLATPLASAQAPGENPDHKVLVYKLPGKDTMEVKRAWAIDLTSKIPECITGFLQNVNAKYELLLRSHHENTNCLAHTKQTRHVLTSVARMLKAMRCLANCASHNTCDEACSTNFPES